MQDCCFVPPRAGTKRVKCNLYGNTSHLYKAKAWEGLCFILQAVFEGPSLASAHSLPFPVE